MNIPAYKKSIMILLGSLVVLPLATVESSASGKERGKAEKAGRGERLQALSSAGATVVKSPGTDRLTFIGTRSGKPLNDPGISRKDAPKAGAEQYLQKYGPLFGASSPEHQLKLVKRSTSKGAKDSYRYQQVHKGVPVIGGEVIVNMNEDRSLLSMGGELSPSLKLPVRPGLSASEARAHALEGSAKHLKLKPSALTTDKPSLAVYDEQLIGPGASPPKLVYKTIVKGNERRDIRRYVLIDANTGAAVLEFDMTDQIRDRRTYSARNNLFLPGFVVCFESNTWCSGADTDSALAHKYAWDTYEFFLNRFGRDGYSGTGSVMISSTHFGPAGYQNAFWDGSQVAFGDGFSRADDVVSHEWTHGVTEKTSGLLYYYQSGAINESISDIFGELLDQTNASGSNTVSAKWLLGEDLYIGAVRNMKNPPSFGDPDKMTSPNYYEGTGDNGGVHFNSGVNNKAAYLMTDGGSFNGRTVSGIGSTKTAKIYYEAETTLITSGSGYADLYNHLYQACQNLVGTSGITVSDCSQVRAATDAVEMNSEPATGFQPQATICPSGQEPRSAFYDDMETSSGWGTSILSGGLNYWYYISGFASSGEISLTVDDIESISDSVTYMSSSVTVPAGGLLHVKHAFDYESEDWKHYDGSVIEYSTNGGGSWTDIRTLYQAGRNYTGTIMSGWGNPLAGRLAFSGSSHGYVSTRYNLSSLAGQQILIRFRSGTDNAVPGPLGWLVDDVRIYDCVAEGDGTPKTSLSFNPSAPDGSNGWFKTNPDLWLTPDASGTTQYKWDSGIWQTYAGSFKPLTGQRTLYYRTTDGSDGQLEETKKKIVKYDPTKPNGILTAGEGRAYINTRTPRLRWLASDVGGSGLFKNRFSNDGAFNGAGEGFWTYSKDLSWTLSSGDGPKTVYGQLSDVAGNLSNVVTDEVFLDTRGPASIMIPPGNAHSTDYSKWSSFSLGWGGNDFSPMSGVDYYRIQSKTGSKGPWYTWKQVEYVDPRTAFFSGTPGKTHYFRNLAADLAGNSSTSPVRYIIVPYNDGVGRYGGGTWYYTKQAGSSYYNENIRSTWGKGASASFSFNGDMVSLITTTGPGRGRAHIYIDGRYARTIDTRSETTTYRKAIYLGMTDPARRHTVKIVNEATSGRGKLEVDGLGVRN